MTPPIVSLFDIYCPLPMFPRDTFPSEPLLSPYFQPPPPTQHLFPFPWRGGGGHTHTQNPFHSYIVSASSRMTG